MSGLRLYLTAALGVLLIAAIGTAVYFQRQSIRLQVQLADERASAAAVRISRDSLINSQKLAWQAAAQHAARAKELDEVLAEFRKGENCDPTDPACGIDAINRILR